jgi:UDP-glucose 4-epimerase
MKNAIVSGASGFVGRKLIQHLFENGVEVTAIAIDESEAKKIPSDEKVKVVVCNLSKAQELPKRITERGFDAFYHLAWNGAGGPKRTDFNIQIENVRMSVECFIVASELKCSKFIGVGTLGEYMAQLSMSRNIASENFIYAMSKSYCHNILKVIANKYSCKLMWCTLSNLYGPGDSTGNLVTYTIRALKAGEVPKFGPAEQPFDFIHIADCVRALYCVGNADTISNDFFIGSGAPRKLKDFLIAIRNCIDSSLEIGIGARPDDGTQYMEEWFDTTALREETNFMPRYTFEAGIMDTLQNMELL